MILAVYLEGLKGILQIRHKVLDSYKQNLIRSSQEDSCHNSFFQRILAPGLLALAFLKASSFEWPE